mgnify:CR=1 FL=1
MAKDNRSIGTLTIALDATVSNSLGIADAHTLYLWSPASFSGTVSVQVSPTIGGDDFATLQDGTTDVTLTANRCKAVTAVAGLRVRLSSSIAQVAAAAFTLDGAFEH